MRTRPFVIGVAVLALAAGAGAVALTVALPATAAVAGPALSVDMAADRHPISPDIYGMNHADEALADALHLPVRRWGGNATTRYNYALDETNRGSDWYFENVPGSADPAQLPDGSETDVFVEQDRRTGTSTILSVPLIGWIPEARDFSCGFSVAKYGPQQQTDAQWRPDCGNGIKPDGTFVTGNDPRDTSVEAGAPYVRDWLAHLTGKYGTATAGGVRFYSLDNEPDLWHATHRDVHPQGASYDEIRDRTYLIGAAVKQADPGAKALGPVGWGWLSLSLSGLDQETCNRVGGSCWGNPPDRAAHGGVPFADWYLAQMRAYEQANGVRILDYFDEHFYPQGTGVAFGNGNDPATNALRLRSTRALWDPSYVDESWIGTPIALIPKMRSLVAANYPGTRTAITEYNWGALDHINGALTQVDVLGIFGREGLDLATLWAPPSATQPGAYAFKMFLNYDGAGSRFGDVGVRATSADQSKLSVYGAQRTSDGSRTIMVVNKTGDDLTSTLSIPYSGSALAPQAQVWRYSAANLNAITRAADVNVLAPPPVMPPGPSVVSTTYPANSITLLVLPGTTGPDTQRPTAPGAPTASGITTTSFTATWPPSTDNVGVTRYQVVAVQGDRVWSATSTTTTATVTGLSPGQSYLVAVHAFDAAGNVSEASPQITVRTLSPPDTQKPTPPGAPTASGITTTSFTATWAPSTDNVGVTGYQVVAVQGDRVWTATSATTTATVTGLSPGQSYLVGVHAFDAAGNVSDASPQITVRTLSTPDTQPPTAPGKPTVTNVTSSSFVANWTPSTDNVGVVRYEVWVGYTDYVYRAGSTTSTSFTVTGLQPNAAYTVSIRAFDAAGNSAVSPSTSVSTPPNGAGCAATYSIVRSWPGGFQAEVTVRNTGSTTLSGWTVRWPYPAGVRVTQLWNATLITNAPSVAIRNANWNGSVNPGQSVTFGFLGTQSSPHVPPVPTCTSP